MRSKLARLAVVSAVCVLPTACATTRYTRSGIAALPPGAKGRTGSNASIEVEGLKLRIETLDRTPKGQEIPPLALRFVFQPRQLGYSFDPAQVSLRAAQGLSEAEAHHLVGTDAPARWYSSDLAIEREWWSWLHRIAPGSPPSGEW